MILFSIVEVFKARGIKNPVAYLVKHHGYAYNTARNLLSNRVQTITLKDLQSLCEILYCTPNDLLEFIPDSYNKIPQDHPIMTLKRPVYNKNWHELIKKIPLNQLEELSKQLQNGTQQTTPPAKE